MKNMRKAVVSLNGDILNNVVIQVDVVDPKVPFCRRQGSKKRTARTRLLPHNFATSYPPESSSEILQIIPGSWKQIK